jgi:hypothetical protein
VANPSSSVTCTSNGSFGVLTWRRLAVAVSRPSRNAITASTAAATANDTGRGCPTMNRPTQAVMCALAAGFIETTAARSNPAETQRSGRRSRCNTSVHTRRRLILTLRILAQVGN